MAKSVIGIDPGLRGAIVYFDGKKIEFYEMPLENGRVCYDSIWDILDRYHSVPIFLERAMPMAMGAKHAFNYGMDFKSIEIAINLNENPVTYIEPNKWCKVMHQGINNNLKPKAKSVIAVKRLFPKLVSQIPTTPKSKQLHEGIVDALLIAGYGLKNV